MKNIMSILPEYWFSKLIILVMTSLLSFYSFRLALENDFVTLHWYKDETKYIYTFLFFQGVITILFYWLLPLIIGKYIFEGINNRIKKSIKVRKTVDDLRAISEIKKVLVSFLGFTINAGLLEKNDFEEKIESSEVENETKEISKRAVIWICILLHTLITAILVGKFNAFYMIPIFVVVVLGILVVWIAIFFIINNIEIMERVRKEIINSDIKQLK